MFYCGILYACQLWYVKYVVWCFFSFWFFGLWAISTNFQGSISLKATLRGQKAGKYFRGYICSSLWPRRILRKYYISFCSTHFKSCLAFWQLKGSLDDPQIKCLSGFSFKTASHSNMITSLIFPSSLITKSFAAIFIAEKKFPAQQVLPWVGNLISLNGELWNKFEKFRRLGNH